MPAGTILVIDDQKELAELVQRALDREGYDVIIATSGGSGLDIARAQRPDLVVLDLTMPDIDGLDVCRTLREDPRSGAIPILVLSARAAAADRVAGLEVGADDYLIKPFEARELVLRVQAILRRAQSRAPERPVLDVGELHIDVHGHSATYAGKPVHLTAIEFRILEHLARHAGRAFSRDEIVESCLGRDAAVTERTVDAHVVNIRRKLGKGGAKLETVWGVGYRYSEPDSTTPAV